MEKIRTIPSWIKIPSENEQVYDVPLGVNFESHFTNKSRSEMSDCEDGS